MRGENPRSSAWEPLPADADAILAELASQGYTASWSGPEPWWSCLLSRPGERWRGDGPDRAGALAAVLGALLPSAAARRGFAALLRRDDERSAPRTRRAAPESATPTSRASTPAAPTSSALRGTPSEPPISRGAAGETRRDSPSPPTPASAADDEIPPDGPSRSPSPVDPEEGAVAPRDRVEDDADHASGSTTSHGLARRLAGPVHVPPSARRRALPALEEAEALEQLEDLRDTFDGSRDALAVLAAERQRLVLLAWTCRFRAVEERCADSREVHDQCHELARLLTSYCKVLWPGDVPALRKSAAPWDAVDSLPEGVDAGRAVFAAPGTWSEAAEGVEEILRRESAASPTRDEDGWSDILRHRPAPRVPSQCLDEVRDGMVKVGGRFRADRPGDPPDPDTALRWARMLRWLRLLTDRPWEWGEAVGRLRRWAALAPGRLAEASAELASGFDPPEPWAKRLGQDPQAKEHRERVRSILRRYPFDHADDPPPQVLPSWLREAFGIWSSHADTITARIRRDHCWALALDEEQLELTGAEHRTARRNFAKLCERLREGEDGQQESAALEQWRRDAAEEPDAVPALEVVEEGEDALLADLRAAVLPRTRRRRALFISNRADPDLQRTLERELALSDLKWSEGKDREVQSLVQAIRGGRYDFVISATGFLGHKVERMIRPVCRQHGVPHVRANKGRLQACLIACRRDLPVEAAPEHPVA